MHVEIGACQTMKQNKWWHLRKKQICPQGWMDGWMRREREVGEEDK